MRLMTEESYFHTLAHTFNQQLAPWRAILLAFLLFYFPNADTYQCSLEKLQVQKPNLNGRIITNQQEHECVSM